MRLCDWISLETMLDGDEERCCVEDDRTQQLASFEHRLEVMGVSQRVSVLSMRIDIFAMGQHIWFGTQLSCMVADQVFEPREVLRPTDLATCELLGGCKVLEVLMIGEHEHDMCRALEVVAPLSEGLKYCKQLPVIDIIVELH